MPSARNWRRRRNCCWRRSERQRFCGRIGFWGLLFSTAEYAAPALDSWLRLAARLDAVATTELADTYLWRYF